MNFTYNDAKILIKSVQESPSRENSDEVEFFTNGQYLYRGGVYHIKYDEPRDEDGAATQTFIKAEGKNATVTVKRNGRINHNLYFVPGERQHSIYDTGFGQLLIGVSGTVIESSLNEFGGILRISYDLDINQIMTSHNTMLVEIKI